MDLRELDADDIGILIEYRVKLLSLLQGERTAAEVLQLQEELAIQMQTAFDEGTCIAFIAHENTAVAGIGLMTIQSRPGSFKNPGGRFGYIMNMFTEPAYRRRGVCTAILNALLAKGTAKGITAYELHASKEGAFVYAQNDFNLHSEPTYRRYFTNQ